MAERPHNTKLVNQIFDLNKSMQMTMVALAEAQAELDDLKLIGMFVDDAVAVLQDRYSSFDIRVAEPSSRPLIGKMNNSTIWVWISSSTYRVTAIVHQ